MERARVYEPVLVVSTVHTKSTYVLPPSCVPQTYSNKTWLNNTNCLVSFIIEVGQEKMDMEWGVGRGDLIPCDFVTTITN
jgi:hypothetical protein